MGGDTSVDLGLGDDPDPFVLGLEALRLFWSCDHAGCARVAARALAGAADPDARALARAVAGLAVAAWVPGVRDRALREPDDADPIDAALADTAPLTPAFDPVVRALLAEAALANARVDVAARLLDVADGPPTSLLGGPHPFLTFMRVLWARVAAFEGEITRAEQFAARAVADARTERETLLAAACAALVRGNADRRLETRELADGAERMMPSDTIARGILVLAAYGVLAIGDAERAARLLLLGGGDADLSRLRIIDRALGLETLLTAALAAGDQDAAESWLARLAPLAEHPIAAPSYHRAVSRVRLAAGDLDAALTAADHALHEARIEGRAIEAAAAEILRAAAQIAQDRRGIAARELAELVSSSQVRGHLAVRRSAARELRRVGRRLPPATASGWAGLSPREREVAMLMAGGDSNSAIAARLYLSEHTVRIHASRVLQAFGVATRVGVSIALAPMLPADARVVEPVALTPRQREVLAVLATGAGNRQIAAELGIAVTTVEKHVAAIMERWGVDSRGALVALAAGRRIVG